MTFEELADAIERGDLGAILDGLTIASIALLEPEPGKATLRLNFADNRLRGARLRLQRQIEGLVAEAIDARVQKLQRLALVDHKRKRGSRVNQETKSDQRTAILEELRAIKRERPKQWGSNWRATREFAARHEKDPGLWDRCHPGVPRPDSFKPDNIVRRLQIAKKRAKE